VIDLHTHTTASDGRCTPEELVKRAAAAAVHVLSVTDHDTVAAAQAAAAACAAAGIEFVSGIEITAVTEDADVHVLGYFLDVDDAELHAFLATQRQARIARVREIIERLQTLGVSLDADAVLAPGLSDSGKAAGRPWIARALVAAGYVETIGEAFERWLAYGRPAFMPRSGPTPEQAFARIHDAGGIASLAHPGLRPADGDIEGYAAAGLDAVEAYHSNHDPETTARYVRLADRLGLAISGGSDYHADTSHGPGGPGSFYLPEHRYESLKARAQQVRR
jgi:predicted metal-dependent phosphoesterase TrpH